MLSTPFADLKSNETVLNLVLIVHTTKFSKKIQIGVERVDSCVLFTVLATAFHSSAHNVFKMYPLVALKIPDQFLQVVL